MAVRPDGPWSATADVPGAIYGSPPSSPAYAVTDDRVETTSADDITYAYTAAYDTGTYVSGGVSVYSTGWYYPPYMGYYYYPYYPSYGYGRYHNPETGAFVERSVWYGPYGGYSYAEGYNPTTGRGGYREVAWDDDDWKSYSEIYGGNRGVEARTERSWDDEEGKYRMDRTLEGEDGGTIHTERTTNVEDGWQRTTRETSRGGSMTMEREWDGEGTMTSSGTIEGADGRSAELTGRYEDGEGTLRIEGSEGGSGVIEREVEGDTVVREGEFTNADGETLSGSTEREGRRRVTELESSTGGELKSVAEDGNRVTVGRTEDGDIYAGKNGEVYKKTDDGWQQYDRGSRQWDGYSTARTESAGAQYGTGTAAGYRDPYRAQLERDARARHQGYQRFEQRRQFGGARRGGRLRRR